MIARRSGFGTGALILIAAAGVALSAMPAGAQRVSAGAQYALSQYAEQGTSLRFSGGGPAGHASVHWRRFGLHLAAARLSFEPTGSAPVAEPFDATQVDVRLRVGVTRLVSVEAGFIDRDVVPLHAAQSVASFRLGALLALPLATGADLSVRASYLGGSRFSGGGSAPFGVAVGFGASYSPGWERVRFTGDLEFQRLDRRTETAGGTSSTPIQGTMARLGVMLVY